MKSSLLLFTILNNEFETSFVRLTNYVLTLLSFLLKNLALKFVKNDLFVK